MSLLSHCKLIDLVKNGVIDAPIENVNGASIDITLGDSVRVELPPDHYVPIDLIKKETIKTEPFNIRDHSYILMPGAFILASSVETFNLPDDIACEYKLKSSLARSGLGHALAGWCNPGWHGSKLTLELFNSTRHHELRLTAGMKIGQMIFFRVDQVPEHASYKSRGQYNNQCEAVESRGLR